MSYLPPLTVETFGSASNLAAALNSAVTLDNPGYASISFVLTIPTGATVTFEGTRDGTTWESTPMWDNTYKKLRTTCTISSKFVGFAGEFRQIRARVSVAGSAAGSVIGQFFDDTSVIEATETITGAVPIQFADSSSVDAFGRLRTADPFAIFDSKQISDNLPLFWDDQQTSGSGTTSTYNTNQASTTIAVSNVTAGTRVRQTFRRFNYQSGRSQFVMLTGISGTGASGITKRVGLFDGQNGLFFQLSGTTLSVVMRSFVTGSAVDTAVAQSSWNLDKMDGTGQSEINLDLTKAHIFVVDYEWLGVGRVRFGFVRDGFIVYCHQISNFNTLTAAYMSSPNLPLRYEISNDGTGAANSLLQICATVVSEGGSESNGPIRSVDRGNTSLVTSANNTHCLIALRLKSTYQWANVIFRELSIICTSTAPFRWALILNPTVTGTALSFTSLTSSAIEYDASRLNTTTISGGTQIASGVSVQNNSSGIQVLSNNDIRLGANIAGTSDILVLAIQRIDGVAAETFFGAINWKEL